MKYWLVIFNLIIIANAAAQSSRWNVKVGYCDYEDKYDSPGSKTPEFRAEVNYLIKKYYIEPGVYGGYMFYRSGIPSFGINLNAHPLPFLLKKERIRFDVYVTTKFGFNCYDSLILDWPAGGSPVVEKAYLGTTGQVGMGALFYIFRNIGLYAEYGYEWFNDKAMANQLNLRLGLTVSF